MNALEYLEEEAHKNDIDIIYHNFKSENIKGLYCDGTIAINSNIETDAEKSCVLAEELGHYYTSYGNIIEQSNVSNRKQEYRARLKGYDLKIGLSGIVDCFEYGCQSIHDMARLLNAPEDYVRTVINCYKSKYGLCVRFEEYLIMFDPALAVIKLI